MIKDSSRNSTLIFKWFVLPTHTFVVVGIILKYKLKTKSQFSYASFASWITSVCQSSEFTKRACESRTTHSSCAGRALFQAEMDIVIEQSSDNLSGDLHVNVRGNVSLQDDRLVHLDEITQAAIHATTCPQGSLPEYAVALGVCRFQKFHFLRVCIACRIRRPAVRDKSKNQR